MYVPLSQKLHYRMIICKITVMDKCLMQPDKWVCAAGMPDPTFCRISMVADPDVGFEVFQSVILYNIISVADQFQNDEVLSMINNEHLVLTQCRVALECQQAAFRILTLVRHF